MIYGLAATLGYTAWDTSTNTPKTGDAGNHTLRIIRDGTKATPANEPFEFDATNCPGRYGLAVTDGEIQCVLIEIAGKSSTPNVAIFGTSYAPVRLPNVAPGTAEGLPVAAAGGGGTVLLSAGGHMTPADGSLTADKFGANCLHPNAVSAGMVTKVQEGLATIAKQDEAAGSMETLLTRLNSTRAGYLDNLNVEGLVAAAGDLTGVNGSVATLLSRITAARAGYWDNLNVGGVVASQADINALNQSASRRVIAQTVGQYERPESGSSTYTVELRTYDADGAAIDADSSPTLTATGIVTGSLAANLGSVTNPATGLYRWTYTVASGATIEQVRFDFSATIDGSAFPMTVYTQVTDQVAATWTTADRSKLTDVFNKLPSKSYIAGTNNADGDIQLDEATGNLPADAVTQVQSGLSTLTGAQVAATTAAAIAAGSVAGVVGGVSLNASGANKLSEIHAKLPSKSYIAGTNNADGDLQLNEMTGNLPADAVTQVQSGLSTLTGAQVHATTAAAIAAGTVAAVAAGVTLANSERVYLADISTMIGSDADEYVVQWFRNGTLLTSGVTLPTIKIMLADESTLVDTTAMTAIDGTAGFRYQAEEDGRLSTGWTAIVIARATIDGSTREYAVQVTRDA